MTHATKTDGERNACTPVDFVPALSHVHLPPQGLIHAVQRRLRAHDNTQKDNILLLQQKLNRLYSRYSFMCMRLTFITEGKNVLIIHFASHGALVHVCKERQRERGGRGGGINSATFLGFARVFFGVESPQHLPSHRLYIHRTNS